MHDRYYIGGGVIAAVAGVSPYMTPLSAYHSIIGDKPEINEATRKFFARRKALEPYIMQILSDDCGLKVARMNQRYTDPDYDFLRAEIDAELEDGTSVEAKSVDQFVAARGGGWGESGSEDMPPHVGIQLFHGLGVKRDAPRGLGVAMVGFDQQRTYPAARDEVLIEEVRRIGGDFWHKHILPLVPPAATTVDDVLEFVVPDPAGVLDISGNSELQDLVIEAREAATASTAAEKAAQALKDRVKLLMNEKTIIVVGGKQIASWKAQVAQRIDITLMKQEAPEIYQRFLKSGTSRVIRFAK